MKVEKILDGFVEYSDFLDNVLIGKTKDGYLTFIQKDDYTIINKEILDKKIVKIRSLTGSDFVECKDVNGYLILVNKTSNFIISDRHLIDLKIVNISSQLGKHFMTAKSENGNIYLIDSHYGRIFDMLPIAKSIKDASINKYVAEDPDYIILETKESIKLLIKFEFIECFDYKKIVSNVILDDRFKKIDRGYYIYTNDETELKTLVDETKNYRSVNEWHNDWIYFENDYVFIIKDKISSSEYKYKLFNIESCTQFDMDFYSIIYPISPKLLLIGNDINKLNLFEIVNNEKIEHVFDKNTYLNKQDIYFNKDGKIFVNANNSMYRLS
ncbi:unknown [Clostridium sp. CAG:465]|nr:unknown [Clostridium sp. CAG:465]